MKKGLILISLLLVFCISLGMVSATEMSSEEIISADDAQDIGSINENPSDDAVEFTSLQENPTQINELDTVASNSESNDVSPIVVNDLTLKGLQNAINSANPYDTIIINGSINEKGDVSCRKVLTIVGENNCHLNGILWDCDRSTTTFKNIVFSGCSRGVILTAGTLFTYNCSFNSNSDSGENGGAVIRASDFAQLTFYDSVFFNNSVVENGGVIFGWKSVKVSLYNCKFIDNKANGKGGVIYTDDNNIFIHDCLFENNSAKSGGVISFVGESARDVTRYSIHIYDSKFVGNHVKDYGGAIYSEYSVHVSNSIFESNVADEGGAIYLNGGELYVNFGSKFIKNEAYEKGGAIYSTNLVWVNDSYFEGNFVKNASVYQCEGGAIYTSHLTLDSSVVLNNSNFTNNYAYDSGGAVWARDHVTVENCLFKDNHVTNHHGGAIYMYASKDLRVSHSSFYGNRANDKGGAIYCDGNSANAYLDSYNSFENNTAKEGSVVFNSGYFKSVKDNWWGTPDPDWDSGLLVEWKAFGHNEKHRDESPLGYNPNPSTPTIVITEISAKYGENPEFKSNVTYNGTDISDEGNVTYNIYDASGNIIDPSSLVGGKTYYVEAVFRSYHEWIFRNAVSKRVAFTVSNATGSFNISVNDITYGDSFVIVITNATGANGKLLTGIINATINNYSYSFNIKNGVGSYEVSDILSAGEYNVSASLVVPNYDVMFANTSFSVNNNIGSFNVSIKDITYGDSFTINITNAIGVNDENLSGIAKVIIDDKEYNVTVTNGSGYKVVNNTLSCGEYFVDAFLVVPNYDEMSSNTTFVVNKLDTVVSVSVKNISYGDNATVNGTVTDVKGNMVSNGEVNLFVNDIKNVTVLVKDGKFSAGLCDLAVGVYNISVVYGGDGNYLSSNVSANLTVLNATGSFNIVVEDIVYGDGFIINVTDAVGVNGALLNGVVDVTVDGNVYSFNVTGGVGSYEVSDILSAGEYDVDASLVVPNYNIMSSNTTFVVNNEEGSLILACGTNAVYKEGTRYDNITSAQDVMKTITSDYSTTLNMYSPDAVKFYCGADTKPALTIHPSDYISNINGTGSGKVTLTILSFDVFSNLQGVPKIESLRSSFSYL